MMGDFISRGATSEPLDKKKKWNFIPIVKKGDKVREGTIIGIVQETETIEYRVLVPVGMSGTVKKIEQGDFTIDETVAFLEKWRNKIITKMAN